MLCFMLPFKLHVLQLSLIIACLGVEFQVGVFSLSIWGSSSFHVALRKRTPLASIPRVPCVGPTHAFVVWMRLNSGLFPLFGPFSRPLNVVTKVIQFWNVLCYCLLCWVSLVSLIPVVRTLDILDPQPGFLFFPLSIYLTLWKISSNLSSSHPA